MTEFPRAMGLAAVQVGHLVRAIIIRGVGVMLNPVVVESSPDNWTVGEECMSYPHLTPVKVIRPKWIKVRCQTEYGPAEREDRFDLWPSRYIMHEIDHLNGITIDILRRRK